MCASWTFFQFRCKKNIRICEQMTRNWTVLMFVTSLHFEKVEQMFLTSELVLCKTVNINLDKHSVFSKKYLRIFSNAMSDNRCIGNNNKHRFPPSKKKQSRPENLKHFQQRNNCIIAIAADGSSFQIPQESRPEPWSVVPSPADPRALSPKPQMAALLNPTARRLAVASNRRLWTPAAVESLVVHWSTQARRSSSLVEVNGGFSEMVASTQRYYVFGGKGGVGKTSLAASLAMKFANQGEPTLIVSMDRARSLGDTFGQDLSDGEIVPVNGVDSLFVAELGHFLDAKEESSYIASAIRNCMGKIGLVGLADPLGNAKLYEMVLTIPGLAECIAIEKLTDIMKLPESNKFRRVVLDTSDTGHTLNILSAVTYMEVFFSMANKVMRLPAIKSGFEKLKMDIDTATVRVEEVRQQIATVRDLIRDPKLTEFLIVTIPTVMAIMESSRFHASLKKDGAPVTRLVVNQVLSPSASECKFCAVKQKEETRALNMIRADRELGGLKLIQASQQNVEVRGVPALRFFSDVVWK